MGCVSQSEIGYLGPEKVEGAVRARAVGWVMFRDWKGSTPSRNEVRVEANLEE